MRMLKDYMDGMLRGELEVITVSDLRSHPGDVLTQVSLEKRFCIKRKGKVVAFLVPPENADVSHKIYPDGSAPSLGI